MAANFVTSYWTPETDAILNAYCRAGLPADEIAKLMGVTQAAVRGRADRVGIKFPRSKVRKKSATNKSGEGHKPFTERCGKLLRAAGVKI
jgi:hypothetical protein